MEIEMTKQMTFAMTSGLTLQRRKFQKSHPWLRFSVDLRSAPASLWIMLGECKSKCENISGVPLRPDIAKLLHQVYLAKGAWGTTSIEGNTLSEEEVLRHVQGKLEVPPSKEYLKQEIDNIIKESNRMLDVVSDRKALTLSSERIKEINRIVLTRLQLGPEVEPGEIRKHSVGVMNYRGAPAEDCSYLLACLCDWLNGPDFEPQAGLERLHMGILKAIIAHLYIEWIHAFGDGNGRTGRLIEVQILLASGVPSPACHLFSDHYNLTRNDYLMQLRAASESNGDVIPFITYALSGFLDGLKGQLAYIRKLHMEVAWLNYVHEYFLHQPGKAAHRMKTLLIDIFEKESPVPISEIDQISPKLAKAYAKMHPRTPMRDIETLEEKGFLIREGRSVRANRDLIASFLPLKAIVD
jgi:Fic family protein